MLFAHVIWLLLLTLACNSQTYLEDAFGVDFRKDNFTNCSIVPLPISGSEPPPEDWLRDQTIFWYGDLYTYARKGHWSSVLILLTKSLFGKAVNGKFLQWKDTTLDAVRVKYGGFAVYRQVTNVQRNTRKFQLINCRHWHSAYILCDILQHAGRPFTDRHIFPILLVDEVGPNEPVIATRRSLNPGNEFAVLWPWPHHAFYARKGLLDKYSFHVKSPRVVFRGALSGPISHIPNAHNGLMKTSRLEVVQRWQDEPWANLGITFIPGYKRDTLIGTGYNVSVVKSLSIANQLKYRYILCIEGADIR